MLYSIRAAVSPLWGQTFSPPPQHLALSHDQGKAGFLFVYLKSAAGSDWAERGMMPGIKI